MRSCRRWLLLMPGIEFDGNRYSVPPSLARRPVSIRADRDEVRILHEGRLAARHVRCYQRGQLIVLPDHRLGKRSALSRRSRSSALEHAFDTLGPEARQFHLHLRKQPIKTGVHLRVAYSKFGLRGYMGPPSCSPPSLRLWSWPPTTPLTSRTFCWRNAGAGSFPRPLCRLPNGVN